MNSITKVNLHQDYYLVNKPPNNTPDISKVRFIAHDREALLTMPNSTFLITLIYAEDRAYISSLSLGDMNIPENSYNEHRLFSNQEDAIRYLHT